VSDNTMIGPGAHEAAATEAMTGDNQAHICALLAIASAINRLADAVEQTATER
jgi:hypothetical protein